MSAFSPSSLSTLPFPRLSAPPPPSTRPPAALPPSLTAYPALRSLCSTVTFPKALQCLNIMVLSDDQCKKAYPNQIDNTMFCAGDQAGRDSCQVRLETSPFIPGDMGLIPDSGNKLSHAEGQLSPLAAMKTQQIITMIMMIIIIMVAQW